jgi:predicted DNA binding CopG/RHH family protein
MRKEQVYEFTQEEFLKRLGFEKDAILVEIFTFQFMEDQRKIKVRVNREIPEKVKNKSP